MNKVMIIDDQVNVTKAIARILRLEGIDADCFENPELALIAMETHNYPVVIADQKMPIMLGADFLAKVKISSPESFRIILSGYSDFSAITKAFNRGDIHQFLSKPWDDDILLDLVRSNLNETVSLPKPDNLQLVADGGFYLPGNSLAMKDLEWQVAKASSNDLPVFIYGETGVGKEMTAKSLHDAGLNSTGDFIAFNCANLSESLAESQLFGHCKGAFTGAVKSQKGLLEAADGGTLFLDEITTLPLALQAKLLRALQEKEFIRVGDTKPKKFNARIITASNEHLIDVIAKGNFREDLYYRLCVVPINVPALRDRGDDILNLANSFLDRSSGSKQISFSRDVKEFIASHPWPGNVRQLENVCRYLGAMVETKTVQLKDLPENISIYESEQSTALGIKKTIDRKSMSNTNIEIATALHMHNNNKTAAAAELGVSRMTLWRKMKTKNFIS